MARDPGGQRRLYVDLLDFDDPAGLPELAPPPLSAALAAVFAQSTGARPERPTPTYLRQLRAAYRPFAATPAAALVAQGRRTCAVLAGGSGGSDSLMGQVASRATASFPSDLVFALSIVDLCHQYATSAIADLHDLVYPDSAAAPVSRRPAGA